ncbi:MAG TPA: TetR/AcrR family transcriptional regulator [Fibrobacteria bacterium]|nr:TetR/AcrR family transcriptional regulator [Fibrobacteria bacterium]
MERSEARERIVRKAMEEILVKGYTKVTMDQISSALGMSKKTIYQLFPGKRELLRTMLNKLQKEIEEGVAARVDDKQMEFRERWRTVLEYIGMQYSRFGPGFVEDLHTAEPEIYESLNAFRMGIVKNHFARLAQEGTQLGVFRKDLDPRLLATVYMASVQVILNPASIQDLGMAPAQAYHEMVRLLFEGVMEATKPA